MNEKGYTSIKTVDSSSSAGEIGDRNSIAKDIIQVPSRDKITVVTKQEKPEIPKSISDVRDMKQNLPVNPRTSDIIEYFDRIHERLAEF